jgi:hypothetical protein
MGKYTQSYYDSGFEPVIFNILRNTIVRSIRQLKAAFTKKISLRAKFSYNFNKFVNFP